MSDPVSPPSEPRPADRLREIRERLLRYVHPQPVDAFERAIRADVAQSVAWSVVQRVAELPDRTSPDDWPEAMLVTTDELVQIVTGEVAASRDGGAGEPTREALLDFARKVIDAALEGCDADGGDIQDWATTAGLLIPTEMQEACGENCPCAEEDDFPQMCYRLCDALRGSTPSGSGT